MLEHEIRARALRIGLPDYVRTVLDIFENNGYEAFVVGGAVRDLLRGDDDINDYDVATIALPEETVELFAGFPVYKTGIKHGTVTVNIDGNMIEVTTYRTDGEYTDSRHPDKVTFTRSIAEDLARRDFTVNAIALSADGRLFDPFGGISDLSKRVIRAVGEPERRFSEDALRIMRAFRFSAKLCYEIEENTLNATKKCAKGLERISRERIGIEWEKLLRSNSPASVLQKMKKCGIFDVIFPEIARYLDDFEGIDRLSDSYHVRNAAVFRKAPQEELEKVRDYLCLSNSNFKMMGTVRAALEELKSENCDDLRMIAFKYGAFACDAAEIFALDSDFDPGAVKTAYEMLPIRGRSDIAVGGNELIGFGIDDRSIISPIYSLLAARIVLGKLENEKNAIRSELPRIIAEIDADRASDPVNWRKAGKYLI